MNPQIRTNYILLFKKENPQILFPRKKYRSNFLKWTRKYSYQHLLFV